MMEDLFRKIPLITKIIFEELDDQSFVNLKDASREIIANLKKERFYWIRVLRSYNCLYKDYKGSWSRVLNRTPAEFVRKIVALIDQFYKDDCFTEDKTFFSPHHIAACLGKLDFYKYFVMRTGVINPKEPIQIHDYGDNLFHLAARRGYMAICIFFVENFVYIAGAVMASITAIVIIGGLKRIANVSALLVPLMSVIYFISIYMYIIIIRKFRVDTLVK